MNLAGLHAIVNKEEIVPTRQASDFHVGSQEIDDLYKHHVRTYIPLQSGSDEASGVSAFALRFIKQVKEAKAPRGYITADFGYGKTSAGLFVWQKAQEARLVAVPPFKLNRLEDLLDATAGWVAYILSKTVPNLVEKAVAIYQLFHNRELDSIVKRYGVTLDQAERMYKDRALQLNITPQDIVRFFEQMTDLVLEAGMEGLVVIPDELQQYLDPEIKSGKIDPLVPLFDIITELMNQQGKLAFGFLMIITSKELGVINDQRGDLIDRLRGNTLDLRAIYDREFPSRLWNRFAETFEYSNISDKLVHELTLDSLGQIASRADLSNGPRTVINAFRRIAKRALDSNGNLRPYSPIDLIDDFLANQIAFDARKLLQDATGKALATSFIRGNHHLEQAVKLLAAFPADGVTRDVQRRLGLLEACNELRASGSPDIVIEIGDRHHPALMLRALDAAQENMDELSLILREFIRNYDMQAANQMQRAVNSFMVLLSLIFKSEQWSTTKFEFRNFARNAEAVFVGTFPEIAKRFPERTVHVRVVGDDESINRDVNVEGECRIVFGLSRHFNLPRQERLKVMGKMKVAPSTFEATFSLNIMLPCFDNLNRTIQDQLRRVIDVEDVSVMMVLALHSYLMDAAERDSVSKPLKEMIKRSMSIRLLEGALEVLLNPAVGAAYGVNGGLIIEKAVSSLISARYGDQYETLITYKQWRDNLRNYISVLRQLNNFSQKQGIVLVEGTKEEIAKKFSSTAASFDAFVTRFPDLLQIEGGSFPSKRDTRKSGVRLTRHALEEVILSWLGDESQSQTKNGKTGQTLKVDEVYGAATDMGYRPDEVKFILDIMVARDLIEIAGNKLQKRERPSISLNTLSDQITILKHDADLLHAAVSKPETEHFKQRAVKYADQFNTLRKNQKESELLALNEQVQPDLELLQTFVDSEISLLCERANQLQMTKLPDDWSQILETMIHANTFTSPLNGVRLKYSQLLQTWNTEASTFRERHSELIVEISKLDLSSLQRFTGRVNQLADKYQKLDEQRNLINQAVQNATNWQLTATDLHKLLDAIQKQGESAKYLQEQLQKLEWEITRDFETQPTKAFGKAKDYQERIDQLKQRVDKLASQAEQKFNHTQDNYRSLFIQIAEVKQENLWPKIIYSPTNPDGVYSNLYLAIEGQIADLQNDIGEEIEKLDTALISFESSSDTSNLELLKSQISKANNEYTNITSSSRNSVKDPDGFEKWITSVSSLQKLILTINTEVQRLREPVQSSNLSTLEKRFIEALSEQKSGLNLLRIRQRFSDLKDEEFWRLFRELCEKQLVEVTLKIQ